MKPDEFIEYLEGQVGQPYLWGGQHTKLTPANYMTVIARKEKDTVDRLKVISFCEAKFAEGADVLYGSDCSGLGMYWLQNLKKIFRSDMTADAMMGKCEIVDKPLRGYWVFKQKRDGSNAARHIGYMISDTELIHAGGESVGVVKIKYKASDWWRVGKPKCFDFDDPTPPEPPEPEPPEPTYKKVKVIRKCRIRDGNGTDFKTLALAYAGHEFPLIGQADKDPFWHIISWEGKSAYITCNTRYTEVVNKL